MPRADLPRRRSYCLRRWVPTLAILIGCGAPGPAPSETPPTALDAATPPPSPPAGLQLPDNVVPTKYDVELVLDLTRDTFNGRVAIDVDIKSATETVWLHATEASVSAVSIEQAGRQIDATYHTAQAIRAANDDAKQDWVAITLDSPLEPGAATISLQYETRYSAGLEGLYKVSVEDEPYAFTQFEPLAARQLMPCFDEPRFKTPFDMTVIADPAHKVIANSALVDSTPRDGRVAHRFATTKPIPTYLLALAVGPLDIVDGPPIPPNATRSEAIPLRGVAVRGRGGEMKRALAETGPILASAESYFGIGYPYGKLDLIAVPDFAAGAMENVGAVTFREYFLLLGDDPPSNQWQAFTYVNAHELAHMWFGNFTTMKWWDDLWLNEAFASWMEHRIADDVAPSLGAQLSLSEWVYRSMGADSLRSARSIREPIKNESDIHNAFDPITYGKGAGVLSMTERWLGADVFQQGVQQYLKASAFGSATVGDLTKALGEVSKRDVAGPLGTFVNQPGVPLISVEAACEDGKGLVTLSQSRYAPLGSGLASATGPRWQVPVCLRYGGAKDSKAPEREQCLLLSDAEQTISLEAGCAGWVLPNAGGAGYYRWQLSDLPALTKVLDRLTPSERLNVSDAVMSAWEAGKLDSKATLDALSKLTSDEERAVALAPLTWFGFVNDELLAEADVPGFQKTLKRVYGGQLQRLGRDPRPDDTSETQAFRAAVIETLATTGADATLRQHVNQVGQKLLGIEAHDKLVVDPNIRRAAFRVAAQEDGDRAWEALATRLAKEKDPSVRRALLQGFYGSGDTEHMNAALDLVLDESRVRIGEIRWALEAVFARRATRELGWSWMEKNIDALLARMAPAQAGSLPEAWASLCSESWIERIRTRFGDDMAKLPGGARNVELAIESIGICAAKVSHHRADTQKLF